MALTQISTTGVKDDAVTSGKIPANAVGSSELADNAVDTAAIADDAVTNAKIGASAAIAGTKISPDFGSQNIATTGTLSITSAAPQIFLTDSNANSDYAIVVNTGQFRIRDETNSADRFAVNSDGHVDIHGRLDAIGGLKVYEAGSTFLKLGTEAGGIDSVFFDTSHGSNTKPNMDFKLDNDLAMRITPTGNVGIENSDPQAKLHINSNNNAETDRHNASNYHLVLRNPQDDTGEACGLGFSVTSNATKIGAAIMHERDGGGSEGSLQFYTNDNGNSVTERVRITAGGDIDIAEAIGQNISSKVAIQHGGTNPRGLFVLSSSTAYQSITLQSACSRNTTNGSYRHFQCSINGVADKMRVYDNGNIENTNNSYGSLSDETLKENIVDAGSQWNDIKNIKVRKFNFKSLTDPDQKTMLGVVAQEAELVCPNLVTTKVSLQEGVEKEYKSFKYSVLYMKAIKCLQEAMAKIETLETKVAALEAA